MSTTSCGSALNGPGVVTLLGPWSSQLPGYGVWARAAVAGRASSTAAVMIRIVRMSRPRAGSVTADLRDVASRPRHAGDAQADDPAGRAAEIDRDAQTATAAAQHARPP